MEKAQILMNNPVSFGLRKLHLSKTVMYDFYDRTMYNQNTTKMQNVIWIETGSIFM